MTTFTDKQDRVIPVSFQGPGPAEVREFETADCEMKQESSL